MSAAQLESLLMRSRRAKADGHEVHAFAMRVRTTAQEARWRRFEKDLHAWTRIHHRAA